MASRRAFFHARMDFSTRAYTQPRTLTSRLQWAQKHTLAEKEQNDLQHHPRGAGIHPDELELLLAHPTWSVESLLPPKRRTSGSSQITPERLRHLLRLSALPPPETSEQEQKMLDTLADQLYFVGKIQEVDTTGVLPLVAIRDETAEAMKEQTVTLDTVKGALQKEKIIGKHHKRIRRDTTPADAKAEEHWDALALADRKRGRYFVVESELSLK